MFCLITINRPDYILYLQNLSIVRTILFAYTLVESNLQPFSHHTAISGSGVQNIITWTIFIFNYFNFSSSFSECTYMYAYNIIIYSTCSFETVISAVCSNILISYHGRKMCIKALHIHCIHCISRS